MKAIFLSFGDYCGSFECVFGTAAFDTDTFQRAILYQRETHLILYTVIILSVG